MDELLSALREVDYCRKEHDRAMHECEVSWGYHGHRYIVALEKAEKRFSDALTAVIDSRIEEKMSVI